MQKVDKNLFSFSNQGIQREKLTAGGKTLTFKHGCQL